MFGRDSYMFPGMQLRIMIISPDFFFLCNEGIRQRKESVLYSYLFGFFWMHLSKHG